MLGLRVLWTIKDKAHQHICTLTFEDQQQTKEDRMAGPNKLKERKLASLVVFYFLKYSNVRVTPMAMKTNL